MFYNTKQMFIYYMTILFKENNLQVTKHNISEWDYIFESMEDDMEEMIEKAIDTKLKEFENTIQDMGRETYLDECGCEIDDLKDKVRELEEEIKNEKNK